MKKEYTYVIRLKEKNIFIKFEEQFKKQMGDNYNLRRGLPFRSIPLFYIYSDRPMLEDDIKKIFEWLSPLEIEVKETVSETRKIEEV